MSKLKLQNTLQYTISFDDSNVFEEKEERCEQPTHAELYDDAKAELLYYISFGSGSSGNSCYIGNYKGGIIVDAGVKTDFMEEILAANGVPMSHVKGILLTHDHYDHVHFAYNIVRQNKHMHIFCSNRVMNALLRNHSISKRIKEYHVPIFKEIPFNVAGMQVTAFDVPHDGSDNMGFFIEYATHRFAVATDLGAVTERAWHYLSMANYMMIEANYDLQMLLHGPYPQYLKARIQTDHGHLDNAHTAAFLNEVYGSQMRYVFLCHLSKDNNTPETAVSTVRSALESKGIKVGNAMETIEDREAQLQLMALPRFDSSRWFVFRSLDK